MVHFIIIALAAVAQWLTQATCNRQIGSSSLSGGLQRFNYPESTVHLKFVIAKSKAFKKIG